MTWTILNADARQIPLADKSVQCVVTSPPYWGLRDYGQEGQIGLEKTPEEYVAKIVAVFREVWRVLRDDGTCWVNLGDSYAGANGIKKHGGWNGEHDVNYGTRPGVRSEQRLRGDNLGGYCESGLKPKDLVGIPWRVAFALQSDGWYLRSDIIWAKPNPMPESVTDRPTKSHEYIFLLTKRERYYFDQDAVREPVIREWDETNGGGFAHASRTDETALTKGSGSIHRGNGYPLPNPAGRNIRTVWEIATQPYPEAHFATFPEEIAVRCIKAGTSEKGACLLCGAPRERVTEREDQGWDGSRYGESSNGKLVGQSKTMGWRRTCKCVPASLDDLIQVPCVVLDPFSGAGTVPLVADKLNRHGIGLELKPDYCRMAKNRCYDDAPLLGLTA